MDVEQVMQKLKELLGECGGDSQDTRWSPYLPLALDSLVSVLNLIRAAELTIAAGASKATVDDMLRQHMLGRMQREAAFMGRLTEQPAAEMEAQLRARQPRTRASNPNGRKTRAGASGTAGH